MVFHNNLFLQQTYLDGWKDYQSSLSKASFPRWDIVILTASHEEQAKTYRLQLAQRRADGLLPEQTHFSVLPDTNGARIGSGGATLNVLRCIRETFCDDTSFENKRILVIHSGGDSKRVPQYSACGKLFSPVPRELPNGRRSTLFDEFMIGMSGVPSRIKEGMLVLSGDVLLLFNPLQIDFSGEGATAISFKEPAETGKDHGVYRMDEHGNVGGFLHKQSVQTLNDMGAVNEQGLVDIDTGAVLLSAEMLDKLYELISAPGAFDRFVNDRARLSFYGDFLYPLASESTRDQYFKEKPEGDHCDELQWCREQLWDVLSPFSMKLLRLAPASFIHFGTTRELRTLMTKEIQSYTFLDWSPLVSTNVLAGGFSANNAIVDATTTVEDDCFLEDSYITGTAHIGKGSVLSFVTIRDERVPENVVLHGLKLCDGRFVVRAYGIEDNPKAELRDDPAFLSTTLRRFLQDNGIDERELWQGDQQLWLADLYPVCDTIEDAVKAALNVCALARGEGDVLSWRSAERMSLYSSFYRGDVGAIIDWSIRLRKMMKLERLMRCINEGGTGEQARQIFAGSTLDDEQIRWLEARAKASDFSVRLRIFYYLGRILGDEDYLDRSFAEIRRGILAGALDGLRTDDACHIAKDLVAVDLPLRVNWGGGWSDTPPYCNEHGGTVLNAAISLNGELPVEVRLRRLDERKVVFESADVGVRKAFDRIEPLQNYNDPYDPFSLHKASLVACGVVPIGGGNLDALLERLGGGIYLSTQVRGVPKGSGLGTSSILAGACVRGIYEFLGKPLDDDELYNRVLCMEQIMSTGGGWQDQVGGITNGIKFITSRPGLKQQINVAHLCMSEEALGELDARFALIYTGQRRLARNLLRDVMGHYISNEPTAVHVLDEIQRLAALMRFELERANIDGFAQILNKHWELSKCLDKGSTNTCIDQIFMSIEDLIEGKMICGAGGGGFLQVIMKRGVSREQLRHRLHEVFQESGVNVWESRFV